MTSLARRAVRCMLDPWGEVRMQSRHVMRELEASGGNRCVNALRGLLSSMDELSLWKSTRSLQGEKGVSRGADGLDVDADEVAALDAHADDWLDNFGWRELVVRVRDALQDDDDVVDDAWRVRVDGGYAVAAAGCSGRIGSCNVMELILHRDGDAAASLGQSSCMRVSWHRTNPVVGRDGRVATAVSLETGHRMVTDVAHLVMMRRVDGGELSRWRISSARPVSSRGGGGNLHGSVAFAVDEAKRMGGDLTDATRLHVLRMLRTHMLGEGDDGLVWAEMDVSAPKRNVVAVDAKGVEAEETRRESRSERAREETRSDRGGHRDEKRRDSRRRDRDDRRDDRRRDSSRKGRDGHRDDRRRNSRKRSRDF